MATQNILSIEHAVDSRQIDAASPKRDELLTQQGIRTRKWMIAILRTAVLVLALGGRELGAQLKWIDPFFFSMPLLTCTQLVEWVSNGTSQGPLFVQVLVTLEETVFGFLIGSVAGVICGIVLGRNKLLSDVFSL